MRRKRAAGVLKSISPDRAVVIAEWQSIQEQRRFVFHRYMEAIAIYVAIVGFAGTKYFDQEVVEESRLFLLLFACVANTLAWLGARQFRRLAYHALDREEVLAEHLGVQKPYGLLWGYWLALALGSVVQLGVLLELARHIGWFAA